jgi:hypothetical protein
MNSLILMSWSGRCSLRVSLNRFWKQRNGKTNMNSLILMCSVSSASSGFTSRGAARATNVNMKLNSLIIMSCVSVSTLVFCSRTPDTTQVANRNQININNELGFALQPEPTSHNGPKQRQKQDDITEHRQH